MIQFPDSLQLAGRARLFWKDFLADFELRFPETRKRWSFDLQEQLSSEDLEHFRILIEKFRLARRVISVLDWPLLLEWGEKKNQAMMRVHLGHQLKLAEANGESEIDRRIQKLLRRLEEKLQKEKLSDEPSFLEVLYSRWEWTEHRAFIEYLQGRPFK